MTSTQSYKKIDDNFIILFGTKVTKSFGGLVAVYNVDFQMYRNEIVGLIGPNGAGKTTLFNLITGVYKLDHGVIRFCNESINHLKPDQICRKGITKTFQIPKPFVDMTTLENVVVGARFGSIKRRSLRECKVQAEEILLKVGIIDKSNILAGQLTLVERKRLEIARALSSYPSIILLDEVVAGLNPTETLEMVELIKKIRTDGATVVMIEHVMKAVMMVSDRIIVLNHGKKIAEGSPEEIVANQDVIEAYLGGMVHAKA
jgi:branched-chain amino acid transport system ATP-binding protein